MRPRCPRCTGGWLYTEPDPEDGPIAVCLQCGWREAPAPLPFVQERQGQMGADQQRRPRHGTQGMD